MNIRKNSRRAAVVLLGAAAALLAVGCAGEEAPDAEDVATEDEALTKLEYDEAVRALDSPDSTYPNVSNHWGAAGFQSSVGAESAEARSVRGSRASATRTSRKS